MPTDDPWARKARGLLRAELKRRDIGYQQLAERLVAMGVKETPASIANKISRGKFTAAFLIQALESIGCSKVDLGDPIRG